jgi:hypothetical protein
VEEGDSSGHQLMWASTQLQADKEVLYAVILKIGTEAFEYTSPELLADKAWVLEAKILAEESWMMLS